MWCIPRECPLNRQSHTATHTRNHTQVSDERAIAGSSRVAKGTCDHVADVVARVPLWHLDHTTHASSAPVRSKENAHDRAQQRKGARQTEARLWTNQRVFRRSVEDGGDGRVVAQENAVQRNVLAARVLCENTGRKESTSVIRPGIRTRERTDALRTTQALLSSTPGAGRRRRERAVQPGAVASFKKQGRGSATRRSRKMQQRTESGVHEQQASSRLREHTPTKARNREKRKRRSKQDAAEKRRTEV